MYERAASSYPHLTAAEPRTLDRSERGQLTTPG